LLQANKRTKSEVQLRAPRSARIWARPRSEREPFRPGLRLVVTSDGGDAGVGDPAQLLCSRTGRDDQKQDRPRNTWKTELLYRSENAPFVSVSETRENGALPTVGTRSGRLGRVRAVIIFWRILRAQDVLGAPGGVHGPCCAAGKKSDAREK